MAQIVATQELDYIDPMIVAMLASGLHWSARNYWNRVGRNYWFARGWQQH
ncbi:hypothetical protein KDK_18450 [Dictyobacter kobayashii]|uniref:Uncharacterized protein n=1 Tax=Dictyobacter kobayashii TaxID=2014872 RepID=A0A402AG41_9CHLR|nr:hypothetical protein KDK_18450 [Dictyobacter kobayashii]